MIVLLRALFMWGGTYVVVLGVLDVAGFAGALVAELGSRVCDCVVAAEGRLNVCVAPFVRRGLYGSVSRVCHCLESYLEPRSGAKDFECFRHTCTSCHARTTCILKAWVLTHHSPKPSAREEALLDELSLLLPAAAEANDEASVDGILYRGVGFLEGWLRYASNRYPFECEMVCC